MAPGQVVGPEITETLVAHVISDVGIHAPQKVVPKTSRLFHRLDQPSPGEGPVAAGSGAGDVEGIGGLHFR